jgi:hypothetical protein
VAPASQPSSGSSPGSTQKTEIVASEEDDRKVRPTGAFSSAMAALKGHRERVGMTAALIEPSTWARSTLYEPVRDTLNSIGGKVFSRQALVPIAVAITFGFNPILHRQIKEGGGAVLDTIRALNDAMDASTIGRFILDIVQSVANNPLVIESNSQIQPDNPALLNGALLVGGVAQIFALGYKAVEYVYFQITAKERAQRGEEPLPATARPELVVVGDSAFGDMLLGTTTPRRRSLMTPKVLAHVDSGIPEVFTRGKVDYHIRMPANGHRLLSDATVQAVGLDRAKQIVLCAFDPDKSVFYGNDSASILSPSTCSTFLNVLSTQEGVCTKQVVLLIPRDATVLQTTPFRQLLTPQQPMMERLAQRGIRVDVIHPEDVVLEMVGEELKQRAEALLEGGISRPLNICLVGDTNATALTNFSAAIKAMNQNVKVTVISDDSIGGIRGRNYRRLSGEQIHELRRKALGQSDLNLIYSDNDTATTDAAAVICNKLCADPLEIRGELQQTVCIVETAQGSRDAVSAGVRSLCVYARLRDKVMTALSEK